MVITTNLYCFKSACFHAANTDYTCMSQELWGGECKKITLSMLFWDHVFSSGDDSSIGFTLKGCKLHE